MKKLIFPTVLAMVFPLVLHAQEIDLIEKGRQQATICATCHMEDGRGSVVPNFEARPRLFS